MLYSGDQVRISHADLVKLRRERKISLGISRSTAAEVAHSRHLKPKDGYAAGVYQFWNIVLLCGLLYSVYRSFTDHWWIFLIGLVVFTIVFVGNMDALQDNLMAAAMIDREFYDKIASRGGWVFKMEPVDAAPYLTTQQHWR